MKKKIEKRSTWINATFATESDEAKWWFNNRKVGGNQMLAAIRGGQAQILTRAKLLDRLAASKKLPSPSSRKQAKRKGLPYQTCIKLLLHETLIARENRKTGA